MFRCCKNIISRYASYEFKMNLIKNNIFSINRFIFSIFLNIFNNHKFFDAIFDCLLSNVFEIYIIKIFNNFIDDIIFCCSKLIVR